MVDESHSAGVVGKTGRGVTERYNLRGKIEILTGTLGKAFGGAMGGFTTGKKEIIDMLRQRSRPYLFSNSMAPGLVGAGIRMFEMMSETNTLPICAVMIYDAAKSQQYAAKMQEQGIFVTGFYYPVVPKGQARIRVQISAAHEHEHLDQCIEAFKKVRAEIEK